MGGRDEPGHDGKRDEFRMRQIHRAIIGLPSAWTGAELGGPGKVKDALSIAAPPEALAGMDELALRLRGRDIPSIRRGDADQPAVNALMARVRHEVMDGQGVALIRGPDPARYDPADYQRLYWALGTHLGEGVIQSQFGDWVARVERNPDLPWRGTTTDMELPPHTDFHELMSLASISLPESGGLSAFVSSLAVHDEILRTRPELLEPLYEGWWNVSPIERIRSAQKTPVYCCVDGKVSCFNNRVFYAKPEEAGGEMPPALVEALAYMGEISRRPEVRADFMMEPGDIAFWHNFQVMHSRTRFEDSAEHRRLLYRLWLNVPGGRPMDEEISERARVIDADHLRARGGSAISWGGRHTPAVTAN
jgi:hypothetical protein